MINSQFLDSNVKKVEFVRTYIGNFWKAADERHGVYEFSCQVEVKRVGTVAMVCCSSLVFPCHKRRMSPPTMNKHQHLTFVLLSTNTSQLKYDTFTHDRLQTHIYLDCQLSDDLKKWTYVCGGEYGVTERGVQKLKAISKVFSRCVFKDEKWMAAYAGDNGDVQKIVDFQTDSPSSLANDEDDKTSDHLGDETSNYEGGERSDHEGDVMSDYEEDEMSAEPSD